MSSHEAGSSGGWWGSIFSSVEQIAAVSVYFQRENVLGKLN